MKFENLHQDVQSWVRTTVDAGHAFETIISSLLNEGHPQEIEQAVYQYIKEIKPPGSEKLSSSNLIATTPSKILAHDREVNILMTLNSPRIVLFGDLLSHDECDQIIKHSKTRLKPSTVVNMASGSYDQDNQVRTSHGASFKRKENALVQKIEKRISALLGCPESRGEPIQILNYAPNAEYKPHMDYFDPQHPGNEKVLAMGGQRYATLIMYLNDVEAGGATIFPNIGLDVLPRKGNGLFFSYINDNGGLDANTLHGGSPVVLGEKWIATKWLRLGDYTGPLA